MTEQASRETVRGDIEGVHYECEHYDAEGHVTGCGYEGYLIPVDWDTEDWARVTCPTCFEPGWVRVYG